MQLLFFLAYSYVVALVLAQGVEWISDGVGLLGTYLRAVIFGAALFIGASVLPVVAKWVLIGRWRPQRIRLWSLTYVRFWCAKTLIRTSPLVLFVGSPLYPSICGHSARRSDVASASSPGTSRCARTCSPSVTAR